MTRSGDKARVALGPEVENLLQGIPLDQLIRFRLDTLLKKAGGGQLQLMAMVMEHVERALITGGLEHCHGHANKTAALLGLHRNTLRAKCKEYAINPADYRKPDGEK
jgi:DNA-binding protein Fis